MPEHPPGRSAPTLRYPLPPAAPWEPAPQFDALRESCPVARVTMPSGLDGWLVTRYQDNRDVLADSRMSRARVGSVGARRTGLAARSLTTSDPPDHTRLRRLISHAFSDSRVTALRPTMERMIARAIDDLTTTGAPADFVAHVSRPFPIEVIGDLLGIAEDKRDQVATLAGVYLTATGHTRTEIDSAGTALREIIASTVHRRRTDPGDDLLSALVAGSQDCCLDDDEVIACGVTLLMAGYAPMSHQIAGSIVALLRERRHYEELVARPDLVPSAIEELLRYVPMPASGGTVRIATESLTIGDATIAAGDAVLPAVVSANRDPSVFHHPDRLDIARHPNPHLAFGHGIHRCLGARLARLELSVVLSATTTLLPHLRLACALDEIDWHTTGMQRGPVRLPVCW